MQEKVTSLNREGSKSMKTEDIVKQLQAVLPTATDLFSESVSITSLTRSGTTVTANTATAHGLVTGAGITIVGAETPTTISSLTFLDGIATAITATSHDLTEGFQDGNASSNPLVTVSGATESEYNGSNPLLSVPNRTKFTYSVTGTPSSPATGTPLLAQSFSAGYNGWHEITVTSPTSFTYEITQTPNSPALGTITVKKGIRVSGAVNIEKAMEAYTAKDPNKLWALVILGDPTISKDRHIESDATDTQGSGTEFRQRMITPFGVFVFVPASSEIAGMQARDQMEDVRVFLYKSLLRVKFDTGLQSDTQYGVITEGDSFFDYNGAVYIHQFIFSAQTDIVYDDTVAPDYSVAFRDIGLQYLDELGTVELTANINLDEES
jgi:hypothetical protein